MEEKLKYIPIQELEVYKLAKELSTQGWHIYQPLDWQDKKTMGDQFIQSTDSVGANIVEGYKRFHFLDKIKFYYNARASLAECSEHWAVLLYERGKMDKTQLEKFVENTKKLEIKLSNFISSTYRAKDG